MIMWATLEKNLLKMKKKKNSEKLFISILLELDR